MEWSDCDTQYSLNFVLSIDTYHCICSNAPLLNPQSILRVAIFYPPEFLGTVLHAERNQCTQDSPVVRLAAILQIFKHESTSLSYRSCVVKKEESLRAARRKDVMYESDKTKTTIWIKTHEDEGLSLKKRTVVNTNMITSFPATNKSTEDDVRIL
jgi:hypothetical protein